MSRILATSLVFVLASALAAPAVSHDGSCGSLLSIPRARIPMDGVLSGGQPTRGQIEAAAAGGFGTVINLRIDQEPGFAWEADAVESLGMRYVSIPVPGAKGLTRENVERLDAALADAEADGPVLLHCASGNRIGALLALRAAWLEGVEADEALAFGRAAGLTRLEPTVRDLLEVGPGGSAK
jgi:uncharacterized protein (TIGR01244 family)